MANPAIGHIDCALCGEPAEVREYSRGKRKRYWFCGCCGMITPNLAGGQQYIEERARWLGAPAANDGAGMAPAAAANDSDAEPKRERKRGGGIFGGIDL